MMRKVHLISVTEPLLFDLALAIHQKGYEVSVSGAGLADAILAMLGKRRLVLVMETDGSRRD